MASEFKRHPLAIAWDTWRVSPEGKGCAEFSSLTPGPYLENRLHGAFNAGAQSAEREIWNQAIQILNGLPMRIDRRVMKHPSDANGWHCAIGNGIKALKAARDKAKG